MHRLDRVLLTNDDGIDAPGIAVRRDLLAARLAAVDRKARGGLLPQLTLGNLISGREALAAAMVWLRSRAA